jgi:hypothetical protein
VAALALLPLAGEVGAGAEAPVLTLVVSAFAEEDVQNGVPRFGVSPVAEARLAGASRFDLRVPPGRYLVMAALEGERSAGAPWLPPAATGGVGAVGPVEAGTADLRITLGPPPGADR